MSSFEGSSSHVESFDTSPRSSTPLQTPTAVTSITSVIPNAFDACMRKTYPDAPPAYITPLQLNRKRRTKGKCIYTCQLCPNWSHGNKANAALHIVKRHPQYTTNNHVNQPPITSLFPTMNASVMLRNSFNKQRYKAALVGLFARRRVPFSMIEWEEVKELCLACNPDVEDLLISSRRQGVRLLVANFDLYCQQVKGLLYEAAGPIHISTDLWTSPHRHALLAVCAQWVDRDYNLRKALIGLPECRHDHSGVHQARLIFDCLQAYKITHNLGCHTSDNASSNDTCVRSIQERLAEIGVNWDAATHRIRCLGHIINLSLQAFLFATSKEALQAAIEVTIEAAGGDLDDDTMESFTRALASQSACREERRSGTSQRISSASQASQASQPKAKKQKRGRRASTASIEDFGGIESLPTLQKLHRLAVWVRSSSLHSDLWDEAVGLRLGIDNATRWSSWFALIDKALKRQTQIKAFMMDHEQALEGMRLIADDWDLLYKAHAFLQPFDGLTRYAEGATSSISQVLQVMDALLKHYEGQKVIYSAIKTRDEKMLHSIEMGWYLLDKYYQKTDEAPIYAAALLLDPRRRAAYLKQNWPSSWYYPALEQANKIFSDNYKHAAPSAVNRSPSKSPPLKRPHNPLDSLFDSLEVRPAAGNSGHDFVSFVESDPIDIGSLTPLEWWCKLEQRKRYPQLSTMAIAILSISPESAEPERVFSGARRTCSWDRLSLKSEKIEIIECLGSWLREGLITPNCLNTIEISTETTAGDNDETDQNAGDDDVEISAFLEAL